MIYTLQALQHGQHTEIRYHDGSSILPNTSVLQFISAWCLLYGSTFEGRRIACAKRMHIHQKVPILISERTCDIMIPTHGLKNPHNIWINYRAIDTCHYRSTQSEILFLNGEILMLDIDIRTIRRELGLCREYLQLLESSPR